MKNKEGELPFIRAAQPPGHPTRKGKTQASPEVELPQLPRLHKYRAKQQKQQDAFENELNELAQLQDKIAKRKRKQNHAAYIRVCAGAVTIQRFHRGNRGRIRASALQYTRHVMLIQRVWKIKVASWLSDKDKGLKFLWQYYIQMWANQRLALQRNRKSLPEIAARINLHIAVHGSYKESLPSRLMSAKIEQIQSAATILQQTWRGMCGRLIGKTRLAASRHAFKDKHARVIQLAWSNYWLFITKLEKVDVDAATRIQKVARGRAARRAVAILRVERREREKKRRKLQEMMAMRDALKTPPTPPQRRLANRLSVREDAQRKQFRKEHENLGKPGYLGTKNSKRRRTGSSKSAGRGPQSKAPAPKGTGDVQVLQVGSPGGDTANKDETVHKKERRSQSVFDAIEEERQETENLAAKLAELEHISQHGEGFTDDMDIQIGDAELEEARRRFHKKTKVGFGQAFDKDEEKLRQEVQEMAALRPDQIVDKPAPKPLLDRPPQSAAVSEAQHKWKAKKAEERKAQIEEEERNDRRKWEAAKKDRERREKIAKSVTKRKSIAVELKQKNVDEIIAREMLEEDKIRHLQVEQEARRLKQQSEAVAANTPVGDPDDIGIGITTASIVIEASRPLSAKPPYN